LGSGLPFCYLEEFSDIDASWRENPEFIFLEPFIMPSVAVIKVR